MFQALKAWLSWAASMAGSTKRGVPSIAALQEHRVQVKLTSSESPDIHEWSPRKKIFFLQKVTLMI